jgi:hypothetical protein
VPVILHAAAGLEDVFDHHHVAALEQVERGRRQQVQHLARVVVERVRGEQHPGRHVDEAARDAVRHLAAELPHRIADELGGAPDVRLLDRRHISSSASILRSWCRARPRLARLLLSAR